MLCTKRLKKIPTLKTEEGGSVVYVCVMMDQWEHWRQGPEETMAADSGLLGFLRRALLEKKN